MSLLTLIQTVYQEVGIGQTQPNAVITSTDANVLQLLALANTTGESLMKRYQWQELITYASFTTSGALNVGTITSCFGSDYDRMVNQTFWDTNTRLPIDGPVTIQQYQNDQAGMVAGPPYYFLFIGSQVFLGPTAIATGHVCTAYYMSQNWCESSTGTGQSSFQNDSDVTVIPQRLFKLDLIWRWKMAKGLSYAEDLKTAEQQIEQAIGGNAAARILYLGGSNRVYPTNIPEGNWPG